MIREDQPFFYFESGAETAFRPDRYSYYFTRPAHVLKLYSGEDPAFFFARLEELSRKFYLAGFFSFELGYALDDAFTGPAPSAFPLAFFGAYEEPVVYDNKKMRFLNGTVAFPAGDLSYALGPPVLDTERDEYTDKISRIRRYIYEGDIFQLNYTVKYKFDFHGSAWGLYRDLKRSQSVPYHVFGRFGGCRILSFSPELFFHKNKDRIIVKPMKGTMARGRTLSEDRLIRERLRNDEKNQSENVMIVDLLRNDLGRISQSGSVFVEKLFEVHPYRTLFQMTSTVRSRLNPGLSVRELIDALFPSGSVTGAPKVRSMELIREMEKEERRIYTGAIGFFTPSGNACFSVAIRTLLLQGHKGELGIGSGIVFDSSAEKEYEETLLKSSFLIKKEQNDLRLIETLLWENGYPFLELHLDRLCRSASYFHCAVDRDAVRRKLEEFSKTLAGTRQKVRLLMGAGGDISISSSLIRETPDILLIGLSGEKVASQDSFLYHKTTQRALFDREQERAKQTGLYDLIFFNERDEVTQGAITNIYVEKKGQIFTPCLECGVLCGVMRAFLLQKKRIREKILVREDLCSADRIYVSNAVIGLRKAALS